MIFFIIAIFCIFMAIKSYKKKKKATEAKASTHFEKKAGTHLKNNDNKQTNDTNNKVHIIDTKGNIIFSTPNDNSYGYSHFSEGLCCVRNGYKFGYIDQTGKFVLPYQFDGASDFKGGVARVKKNDKWGLINSTGKLICPYYHDNEGEVPTIHDGIICRYIPDKDGHREEYIDINGNIVIDTSSYSMISDEFCNGYTSVWNNSNECALIDTKGNIVIPFGRYNHIGEVHNGVACVSKYINGKKYYGFVNTAGVEIVPIGKYDNFFWHKHPDCVVVCVVKNGKCGYIDKQTGKELIPCEYNRNDKSDDINIIGCGKESSMININLKYAYPDEKTYYTYNSKTHRLFRLNNLDDMAISYSEGLCAVLKNGKVGFIDENGSLVIPFNYKSPDKLSFHCLCFHEGVCAINNIIIDKQGNTIKQLDETFTHPYYIGNGIYSFHHKSGKALVDVSGNIIFDGYKVLINHKLIEFPLAVIDKYAYENTILRFIDKNGKNALPYKFKVFESDGHILQDMIGFKYGFVNGFAQIGEPINE